MLQARADIAHLTRFFRRVGADIVLLGLQPPVENPVFLLHAAFIAAGVFTFDLAHDPRAEMAVFGVNVIEGRHGFDDMRVGIYGSHGYSSNWRGNITTIGRGSQRSSRYLIAAARLARPCGRLRPR